MVCFASIFVSGLVEKRPLGTMAAVEIGVVLMLVVVVEEFRVTQVTGTEHVTGGGVITVTSSA